MSREIQLSRGMITIVDDEDFERFGHLKWSVCASDKRALRRSYYAVRTDHKVKPAAHYRLHREIMNAPAGMFVDHIDGDSLNNTRANLRVCTPRENARNRNPHPLGNGLRGFIRLPAYRSGGERYRALITLDGKTYNLGVFPSQIDAARAYDAKAVELHGEFATLNFPEEHGRPARRPTVNPEHLRLLPGDDVPEGAELVDQASGRGSLIPVYARTARLS